jgi:hypothetical protein
MLSNLQTIARKLPTNGRDREEETGVPSSLSLPFPVARAKYAARYTPLTG